MIDDAEKNASVDKSKKSMVNITYELDNLLLKVENILAKNADNKSTSILYFEEVVKEIKKLYSENQLNKIQTKVLSDLKYASSILVLESLKETLGSSTTNNSNIDNSNVIDITEE